VRAVLRDVFGCDHVDAVGGWLVLALPPAELGVHPTDAPPSEGGTGHPLTLVCDDIGATIDELRGSGLEAGARHTTWVGASPRLSSCPVASR